MITLSKKDVGQKFRNAKGEVLTLTKWLDNDPEFPARLGDDGRNYNANGRRFLHREERDTLVARVEENPPCLKTRLRTREIGRKFKCRGGAIATLKYRHGSRPGVWVGTGPGPTEMLWEANGRACRDAGASSWDLVERLPVEKKPAPKAEPKFKVGDRVKIVRYMSNGIGRGSVGQIVTVHGFDDFQWSDGTTGSVKYTCDDGEKNALPTHCFDKVESKDEPKFKVGDKVDFLDARGKAYKGWTGIVVTELVHNAYCGPSLRARSKDGCIGLNEVRKCRRAAEPNRRPYPDYKKMKAALEDIRDNSPIGSDVALKAKAGLEGVEC